MICPMKFNNSQVWRKSKGDKEDEYRCHKEQCAWWSYSESLKKYNCAVLSLAFDINMITINYRNKINNE